MEVTPILIDDDAPRTSATNRAILVMDDEEEIRNIVATMLECLGYEAVTCINGEEAIWSYRTAKSSGRPFLAAIMDLIVVNGMGGRESAQLILAMDPDAKLIVSSGFSGDLALASPQRAGFRASLPKPFTVRDLALVLSDVLTQDPDGEI